MTDAKLTQMTIFDRSMKKAAKRKCLTALNLNEWAREDSNLGPMDYESTERNTQPSPTKEVSDASVVDLAENLASIIDQHPELTELVKVWPELSEAKRRAIVELTR